jgi:RNA polymerase sigma factor (sigma-70 family)
MTDVFIINESAAACSTIAAAIMEKADMRVCGMATSVREVLDMVGYMDGCDVILVSANLPDAGTLKVVRTIKGASSIKMLVTGVDEENQSVLQFIEAGATGYTLARDSLRTLIDHIQAVNNGKALISPKLAATLMHRVAELAAACPAQEVPDECLLELTPREREVVDLIGKGLSNQEIASELFISVGTVKNHVHNILQKLEVNSRHDVVAWWNGDPVAAGLNGAAGGRPPAASFATRG